VTVSFYEKTKGRTILGEASFFNEGGKKSPVQIKFTGKERLIEEGGKTHRLN